MPSSVVSNQPSEQFHDAASQISRLTMHSTTARNERDADFQSEAEDECGDLYAQAHPSRHQKRFSTLSMASSIAAIVPFINTASDLKPVFAVPATTRQYMSENPPVSNIELSRQPQARNRKRLHGSVPRLTMLLQRAAANAQIEGNVLDATEKAVNEWSSSLDASFDVDVPSSEGLSLKFQAVQYDAAPPPSGPPPPPRSKPSKPNDTFTKWKLRPLSTWGRKSALYPQWTVPSVPASPSGSSSISPLSIVPANMNSASSVPGTPPLNNTASKAENSRSQRYSLFRALGRKNEPVVPVAKKARAAQDSTASSKKDYGDPGTQSSIKTHKIARIRKFWHTIVPSRAPVNTHLSDPSALSDVTD